MKAALGGVFRVLRAEQYINTQKFSTPPASVFSQSLPEACALLAGANSESRYVV